MRKFFRTWRRRIRHLIFWLDRPLPREEWMSAFNLGKVAGKNEALAQLPITQVQPMQITQPQRLTIRQKAALRKKITLVRQVQPPAMPPVQHDDSWLNSVPKPQQKPVFDLEGPQTERMPAIVKLRHSRGIRG